MRLLRLKDYNRQIQPDNLDQILQSDYSILQEVEQAAQAEMASYLVQRYQVNNIFSDTQVYNSGTTYYGKDLIEYTAPAFTASTTYNLGDHVVCNGFIYTNLSATTFGAIPSASTSSAIWSSITEDNTLYYAKLNQPEWSYSSTYSAGNVIWFNNITYQALQPSTGVIPSADTSTWSAGTVYSFSNELPENTNYWVKSDNRNQLIVQYLIDIVLYHLHSRINPRNIPEIRAIRYDGASQYQTGGAIGWLRRVASGDITAELPQIVPQQGMSIRWGSNTKNTNSY